MFDKVVEQPVERADLRELREDQLHDTLGLSIRVFVHVAVRQLDVAERHGVE